MVNSTDRVHTLILTANNTNWTTAQRIFLPEFGLIKDKLITKLNFDMPDAQQGTFESIALTLRHARPSRCTASPKSRPA